MKDADLISRVDAIALVEENRAFGPASIINALSAIPAVQVGVTPEWLTNCAVCCRVVDTREASEGGDAHGCEYEEGWACSSECAEKLSPDPEWLTVQPSPVIVDDLCSAMRDHLAQPSPDVAALTDAEIAEIERGGKRWHGEAAQSYRWEPYKPDGQRQMKAKGRWQRQVGSGDFWRWENCERPAALSRLKGGAA